MRIVLSRLVAGGVLEFNEMNRTYDINDGNTSSYTHRNENSYKIEETSVVEVKDNSIIIEAAVVKILKRKKVMPKTELSNEVLTILASYRPKIEDINSAL